MKFLNFTTPIFFILIFLVLHILVELQFLVGSEFALLPLSTSHWYAVFTAPFFHSSWSHLLSNLSSLVLAFFLLFSSFKSVAHLLLALSIVLPGAIVWFFGRPAFHLGASGILYSLLFFLFFIGIFSKQKSLFSISAIVLILNAGLVWGILPYNQSVSWEYHLSGAVVGSIMAILFQGFDFTLYPKRVLQNPTNMSITADDIICIYKKKSEQ